MGRQPLSANPPPTNRATQYGENKMAQETLHLAPSSNIAGAAYDSETLELTVEFKGNAKYLVSNVPPQLAEDFASAPSAGKFYNVVIRDQYVVVRV